MPRATVELLSGDRAELGYSTRRLNDGERFEMGEVVFEVLHTPGHTPEHISFLLIDRSRGDEPCVFLSGGSLLVGDVARPDLLGSSEQIHQNAGMLCRTLQKVLKLPDFVEVYPTHVSGSLCGGAIGSRLSTTVGYERRMSKLLSVLSSEANFVVKFHATRGGPRMIPVSSCVKAAFAGQNRLKCLNERTGRLRLLRKLQHSFTNS